jgi:hypothetical protein
MDRLITWPVVGYSSLSSDSVFSFTARSSTTLACSGSSALSMNASTRVLDVKVKDLFDEV